MKITKATEITNDDACYLIYGNPGFGKTTTISFIPGKTLVINIDKSAKVLAGNPNIDIADVDTHKIWDEWLTVVKELLQGQVSHTILSLWITYLNYLERVLPILAEMEKTIGYQRRQITRGSILRFWIVYEPCCN